MPAVKLSRLKEQINFLCRDFESAEDFRRGATALLELYSDRVSRPGQMAGPRPVLPEYRTPPLVLRLLEQELAARCALDPAAALRAADALWSEFRLETRLLAAAMLGSIPLSELSEIVDRLEMWSVSAGAREVLQELLVKGFSRLRRERSSVILELAGRWLNNEPSSLRSLGIQLLIPLIEEESFQNLPAVFHLTEPIVQQAPRGELFDLERLIRALASRSPSETVYFLRRAVAASEGQSVMRLARRCLDYFSETDRASLRSALQIAKSPSP